MAQALTIPGGRDKGKLLTEVADDQLRWWVENGRTDQIRQACEDELAARGGGQRPRPQQAPAPAQRPTGLATRNKEETQRFAGSFRDPQQITKAFQEMSEFCHLVTPATMCGSLPEGCEIATSLVYVNGVLLGNDSTNGDVYKTDGGKLGLHKNALDKISQAAGISWIPQQCGRLDDRSDPRYVEYRAVGKWKLFDGTEHVEQRSRAVDLRDGSDELKGMTDKQITQQRKNILTLAESKAMNRVVRALGLKSSYAAVELEKPFAIARLMFTGRTDDPELRREFALRTQQSMQGGHAALYGAPPQPIAPPALNAPPPVGGGPIEADGESGDPPSSPNQGRPSEISDDDYGPPENVNGARY